MLKTWPEPETDPETRIRNAKREVRRATKREDEKKLRKATKELKRAKRDADQS